MAEASGIRWHGATFHPNPEDWQCDEGRNVLMADCGKGMPPAIGSLIKVVDQRPTFTGSNVFRVRDIQRIAQYRVVGLVVSEATREEIDEADAARQAAMEAAAIRDAVRTMERLSEEQRRNVLALMSGVVSADRAREVAAKLREVFDAREDKAHWAIIEQALALLGQPKEG